MTKRNLGIAVYIVIALGLVGWWTYVQFIEPSQKDDAVASQASARDLDNQIQNYEAKLLTNPDDIQTMIALASVYMQKVRETADVSYYSNVESLAQKVIELDPKQADAYAFQGEVSLGKHNFQDALRLGNKSLELNPNKALYYGIVADAQTELGQNDAAIDTLQKMVDKRPDFNSYSRIAYARELHGEIDGAKEAIKTAVEAGSSFSENVAWGEVEYGKLALRSNLDEAELKFKNALEIVVDYPPALEGLGRVYFAKGDVVKAQEYFQRAFDKLPIAQYATDLGDVNMVSENTAKAQQYYSLAQIAFDKSQSSGVNTDLERALFLADHDLDLDLAKQLAERSYAVRPSIYGADVLAWTLYKNNDAVGAQKYITEALRLGEHDPLIVFHAAKIAEKNGDSIKAGKYMQTVKTLGTHFSVLHSKEINLK